ncbi:MAG: hypothetical protein ACFFBC_05670 [Promethearchaeota archaeon]
MKKLGKGFWAVLFGLGFIFVPGLILNLVENKTDVSNLKDNNEEEKKKDKDKIQTIEAICDLNPNKLNLKSKGKWITVYIELPENYDVHDIILGEILLNDYFSPELKPFNIGDNNDNGIPDLMIKFDRSSVISNLESSQFGEMTISGRLQDGIKFKGVGIIELKNF